VLSAHPDFLLLHQQMAVSMPVQVLQNIFEILETKDNYLTGIKKWIHFLLETLQTYSAVLYEKVSIISGTGAAICTIVIVAQCNSRCLYKHILGASVQYTMQLGICADFLHPFI
jgi:hypothetical protein